MPTETVSRNHPDQLQEIADMVCGSNKILVVTGAGISTNSGIPDFRSQNGLYNLVKSRYPNYSALVKGRDLFDSILFTDPTLTSIFFSFLSELRQKVEGIDGATETHKFIKNLADTERLLRCYTQNIDGLESRDGLCMDVTKGVGKRGKGKDRVGKEIGCEVVQLHGDLEQLRCTLCGLLVDYTPERLDILSTGEPPDCPECSTKLNDRLTAGKRSISVGTLRPNIVLYNEPHPKGELIGKLTHHDATRANPDLMVIIGTSLKVIGLKRLVKAFASKIHEKGGKVLYINNIAAADSVWGGILDYHIQMDCDDWVRDLKVRRKEIWEKMKRKPGRRRTMNAAYESDKENRKDAKRRKSMPAPAKRSKSDMHLLTPKKSPLRTISAPSTSKRSHEQVDPFLTPSKRQRLNASAPSTSSSVIKLKGSIPIYDDTSSPYTEAPSDLLTPTPKRQILHSVQIGTGMTPRRFLQCVSIPTTPSRKDLSPSKNASWIDKLDDELAVLCSPLPKASPLLTPSRRLAMGFARSPSKTPHRMSVHNTPSSRRDSNGFRIGSATAARNRIVRCSVSPPPPPVFHEPSSEDRQLPTPPTSQESSSSPTFEVQILPSRKSALTLDQRQLQEELELNSSRPSTATSARDPIQPMNFYTPPPPLIKKKSRNSLAGSLPPLSIKTRHILKAEKLQQEIDKPGTKTRARRRTLGI